VEYLFSPTYITHTVSVYNLYGIGITARQTPQIWRKKRETAKINGKKTGVNRGLQRDKGALKPCDTKLPINPNKPYGRKVYKPP